jgi:hypothetical protein
MENMYAAQDVQVRKSHRISYKAAMLKSHND